MLPLCSVLSKVRSWKQIYTWLTSNKEFHRWFSWLANNFWCSRFTVVNCCLYSDTCMEGTTHLNWCGLAALPCTRDFHFIFFHILLHSPTPKAPSANACYYPLVVNVAKLKGLINTAGVRGPYLILQLGFATNTIGIHPTNTFCLAELKPACMWTDPLHTCGLS